MPSTTLDQILNPGGKRPRAASIPVSSAMEGAQEPRPAPAQTATQPNPAAPVTTQTPAQINTDLQKANQGKPQAQQAADRKISAADLTAAPAPLTTTVPQLSKEQQTLTTVKPKTYDRLADIVNYLYQHKIPTKEDLEKEEKLKKRQQLFSAIGDGLSSLSNLYFTTQSAPNMYDGTNSLDKTVEDRWDKIKKEHDANLKEYSDALMKAKYYDALNDQRSEKAKAEAEKAKAEAARKDAIADAQRNKYAAASRKDDATAAYYAAKADALEKGYPYDVAIKEAQAAKLKAEKDRAERQGTSQWVSGKGGKSGSSGSGSGKKGHTAYYSDGREKTFTTKDDADNFARQQKTWQDDYVTERTVVDDGYGGKKTTDRRRRVGGHRIKPEPKAQTQRQAATGTAGKNTIQVIGKW